MELINFLRKTLRKENKRSERRRGTKKYRKKRTSSRARWQPRRQPIVLNRLKHSDTHHCGYSSLSQIVADIPKAYHCGNCYGKQYTLIEITELGPIWNISFDFVVQRSTAEKKVGTFKLTYNSQWLICTSFTRKLKIEHKSYSIDSLLP